MTRNLRFVLRQVVFTNKAFWRNPASAFFTFAFPLMFLVIFTTIFGNSTTKIQLPTGFLTVKTATFYVAAMAAFSVITACYTNIAISVTFARDTGILKRTRGTPMPSWAYILARMIHAVIVAIILVVVCTAFGAIFYGASIPGRTLPAFILTVVVGAATFASLGLALVSAIPNADASPAVVNATILPILFLSDIFIPFPDPPTWVAVIQKVFPVGRFAKAMQGSFFAPTGNGFEWVNLAVVLAWGVAGLLLAARFFTWEPRR